MTAEQWPPSSYKRLRYLMDHGMGQRATGPCAIPGCARTGWKDIPLSPQFVWDHCHLHDFVRGELCRYHNVQMGHVDRYAVQSFRSPQKLRDHWARCPECAAFGPWHPIMVQQTLAHVRFIYERATHRRMRAERREARD
jgi:hypothetical protein